MKLKTHLIMCIFLQIGLIYLIMHKKNYQIFLSFKKQKYEKEQERLLAEKNQKNQELLRLQDRNLIKEFAQRELGMQKLTLNQIHQIHEITQ